MVCVCGAGWLASSPSPPLTFRRVKRELGGIAIFLGVMRKGKGGGAIQPVPFGWWVVLVCSEIKVPPADKSNEL